VERLLVFDGLLVVAFSGETLLLLLQVGAAAAAAADKEMKSCEYKTYAIFTAAF
jgi:hypothetical protein